MRAIFSAPTGVNGHQHRLNIRENGFYTKRHDTAFTQMVTAEAMTPFARAQTLRPA
jgi:hypothetical protein